jgi:hypothetical protein
LDATLLPPPVLLEHTDGNGYPTPANPTGTRIKWRRVWLKKKTTGLHSGTNPDPPGLAEAGLEVVDPYPLTRRPDTIKFRPHISLTLQTLRGPPNPTTSTNPKSHTA